MVQSGQKIEAALRHSFIFPLLGESERQRFIASARPQSWRAGQAIFLMGDPGASMILVQTGEVTISYPAPDGRTLVMCELHPGEVFGEIALLDGGARSADATARTNCTLMFFKRAALLDLLKDNWPLAEALLKLVCARLRRSDARMADLAFGDLPGRLARTLLARARPAPDGSGPRRVSDTQGALATLAGGSRESINRTLRKWQQEGLVAMADGRISLLAPENLARVAG